MRNNGVQIDNEQCRKIDPGTGKTGIILGQKLSKTELTPAQRIFRSVLKIGGIK
jgi:hypothetical protein